MSTPLCRTFSGRGVSYASEFQSQREDAQYLPSPAQSSDPHVLRQISLSFGGGFFDGRQEEDGGFDTSANAAEIGCYMSCRLAVQFSRKSGVT